MRRTLRGPTLHPRRLRGQTLVEFALIAPIFIFLLIGIIEGGRFVFYAEHLNNATREGARYQVVHGNRSADPTGPTSGDPTGEAVKQAVLDAAMVFQIDLADVALEWSPDNNRRGTTITVRASYEYAPIINLFGPITVEAESSLVINN
jgi:Flp pilus assembly protein TadG